MKKPLKNTKTNVITVDDKHIPTDALPVEIRYEIETLDEMLQRLVDLEFEFEVMSIAAKAKQHHIEMLVKQLLTPPAPVDPVQPVESSGG